jgi:nitroreductase
MLAAADVGVGSCHAALDDQALARRVLELPDDRFCVGMVSLGYPAERPLAPLADHDRRPFSEVVRRERWTT